MVVGRRMHGRKLILKGARVTVTVRMITLGDGYARPQLPPSLP